jgi:hypothetical protein
MKDNALYLEADEDITSAIDKLGKSQASSVQIVVPKRSTMLQSIINLKLLKKAAESHGKALVLVTNDKIATELAARVGLAVAPSLGAKAVIGASKSAPKSLAHEEEIIEAGEPDERPAPAGGEEPEGLDDDNDEEEGNDSSEEDTDGVGEPKGEMSAAATSTALATLPEAAKKSSKRPPLLKRREISDEPPGEPATGKATGAGLKIPNFDILQRRLLWVVLALAVTAGYWGFMYFFTSAKVTLFANGSRTSIDTAFAVDTSNSATTDLSGSVLAGQKITFSKDLNSTFAPTGQQDIGTKATGKMTIVNSDVVAHDFVAGTRFQAPDGKIFHLDADTHVDAAIPVISGHNFTTQPSSTNATVTADQNGDGYNEAPAKYSIPGLSTDQQQYTSGQGDQMSGGTSKVVTVVQQSDVDTAKAALLQKDQGNASQDLSGKLPSGYVAVPGSQTSDATGVQSAPDVGSQGTTATLTKLITRSWP